MATNPAITVGTSWYAPTRTSPQRARPRTSTPVRLRLQHAVDRLPTLVPGCHHASITTVALGRLSVRVATDGTGRRADELQDELDEGPALHAVRTGHSVVTHDLGAGTRWTDWCSAVVAELALSAALSVLLVTARRPLATLNLYSDTADGLSRLDVGQIHALAAPLAATLLAERSGMTGVG